MYVVFIDENRRMKPDEILLRSGGGTGHQGLMLIFLASQEAQIKGIMVLNQPRQKVSEILS
jgi:dihydroxyacetone kinase